MTLLLERENYRPNLFVLLKPEKPTVTAFKVSCHPLRFFAIVIDAKSNLRLYLIIEFCCVSLGLKKVCTFRIFFTEEARYIHSQVTLIRFEIRILSTAI